MSHDPSPSSGTSDKPPAGCTTVPADLLETSLPLCLDCRTEPSVMVTYTPGLGQPWQEGGWALSGSGYPCLGGGW